MSLLQICQDVAIDVGITPPVQVVGNIDPDARRLLRFASRVGRELATRAAWQALRLERVFTATSTEEQVGAIPPGFLRFAPETLWDRSNYISITGPISPTDYQSKKNAAATSAYGGPDHWFTRRGDALLVWPVPQGGAVMSFEYQSAAFCQSAGGVPQVDWQADTDTARISAELITLGMIHRFLEADGQPSLTARADFERRLAQEIANDAPGGRVLLSADMFGTGRYTTGEPGVSAGRGGDAGGVWGGSGGGFWG